MKFRIAIGALVLAAGMLLAASVPFDLQCDMQSGFLMSPGVHKRIGYITAFQAFGAPKLGSDLTLSLPFTPSHELLSMIQAPGLPPVTKVVGVIQDFSWSGGAADPLKISFFVSQENATLLRALQQTTYKTNSVSSLGWWIGDYDQEAKVWFDEAYPVSSSAVSGTLTVSSAFSVNLSPVPVAAGIDVNVYEVSIQVSPAQHKVSTLAFANSSRLTLTKSWGTP